jgi:integrase
VQDGTVIKHRGFWTLRYYDTQVINGVRVRKRVRVKLAPANDNYPNKKSVELLKLAILTPLNAGQVAPESAMPVTEFIEKFYLPFVKTELRPSTYKDYGKDIYERHLKHRLGNVRVRDFQTVTGQRLIATIAKENATEVGHKTLLRIKSFLSGTFKHAKREGLIGFENPMRDVSVPGKSKKFHGPTYDVDEIAQQFVVLQGYDTALAVVSTASLAGLRLAELRGLLWSDYDGARLNISRTVWRTHIGDPKTLDSEASVPVLPVLKNILDRYKAKVGGQGGSPLFAGERRGTPLNLHNLANRIIKPIFEANDIEWKGWHAYRRGLATNLISLGVHPKVVQAILRHSDLGTTLAYYVITPESETRGGIQKLEHALRTKSQLAGPQAGPQKPVSV